MEHQLSFADSEYQNKRRQTRKEKFLGRMETLVLWTGLESVIEPYYPKVGNGRCPYPFMKASIRAKVEHPFLIIKCQFGFTKARYRGLIKNDRKLAMLLALANIVRVDQMIKA